MLFVMKKGLFNLGDEDRTETGKAASQLSSQKISDSLETPTTQSQLKEFTEKISRFIERAKILKEENINLARKNQELLAEIAHLKDIVNHQAREIETLKGERSFMSREIQEIMLELEKLEL